MAKATAPKTPSSSDYVALSVNDKKSGSPTNRIQLVMRNWRKRHLPKLETTEFLPQHTNTVPPPSEVEKALVKIWKGVVCKNQLNPLILNSPFTSARTSHFWGGRMKKAKDPVFFKVAGNSIFCVLHIFSLSRIVCFLLANVILFVNINPSRWGTLNYDWGGWEYKKHSKYQYCPESSNRTHHLPIKKTFQPAIIRSVCHSH